MSSGTTQEATWFGHPRQLALLFSTELFERFGYYGMRAILTLYLAKWFLFSDSVTQGLYGAFTSLVYLTPLFGGLLADRYLGSKRSVKFGAILMAIGYFGLCFGGKQAEPKMELEGKRYSVQVPAKAETDKRQIVDLDGKKFRIAGQEDGSVKLTAVVEGEPERTLAKGSFKFDGERDPFWVNILFLSLACVIVGNGFFKPNISTIVGTLYAKGDGRRDAGFTIFYMGINLGSLISQFLCPLLAEYAWWAGFLLAAFGMCTSYCLFQFDGGRLAGYGEPPGGKPKMTIPIYLGAILSIPLVWFLMHNMMVSAEAAHAAAKEGSGVIQYLASLPLLGKALFAVFLVAVIGIPAWAVLNGSREEAQKMVVAIVLVVFSVVFWTLFEQAGSSLTLYADRNTDKVIDLGFWKYDMPSGQIQIFNALFIVMFAPVFSWIWVVLAKRNLEPSTPVKFAYALALVGVGFLVLVFGAKFADSNFQVGLFWLALAYLIHSIGELCLSPVGLSMITKLSIPKVVGLMMGVWFLSSSMAQYVGGVVAQFASVETVAGEVTNPKLSLDTYVGVFNFIGWASIGFGVLLFALSPLLKKMMHDVR